MTQSDYDFVGQIIQDRFPDPPVRVRASAVLGGWYSVLIAGALFAGAVIGLAT